MRWWLSVHMLVDRIFGKTLPYSILVDYGAKLVSYIECYNFSINFLCFLSKSHPAMQTVDVVSHRPAYYTRFFLETSEFNVKVPKIDNKTKMCKCRTKT